MQKSNESNYVLESPSTRIPEIAAGDEPVLLYSANDNACHLMAGVLHDFSDRNDRPIVSVECRTREVVVGGLNTNQPIRRNLDEVLAVAGSGHGQWFRGGSVVLNNFAELDREAQQKLVNSIRESLKCRIYGNMYKARTKPTPAQQPLPADESTTLVMPPLRNHEKNIRFFANYFLAKANVEWARDIKGISPAAMKRLTDYAWPGDLEELREAIFQSVLLAEDGGELSESALPMAVREFRDDARSLRKAIVTAEHKLIQQALQQARNNKKKAAAILNISRKTLYSKLRLFEEFAA